MILGEIVCFLRTAINGIYLDKTSEANTLSLQFAGIFMIILQPAYNRKLAANNDVPIPEWRLPPVIVGGVSFAIGEYLSLFPYLAQKKRLLYKNLTNTTTSPSRPSLVRLDRFPLRHPLDRAHPLGHSNRIRPLDHFPAMSQLSHRRLPRLRRLSHCSQHLPPIARGCRVSLIRDANDQWNGSAMGGNVAGLFGVCVCTYACVVLLERVQDSREESIRDDVSGR